MNTLTEPLAPAAFARLVWNLAQRELKSRFKGTILGWLWSLIVPLASLALYAVVFGVIFRAQVQPFGNGHPPVYAVWLFVGLIAFHFLSNSLMGGADSLWTLAGVLNRVRIPVLAPVFGRIIAVGLQSLVELTLYLAVLVYFRNVSWTWLLMPAWILLFVAFTAGATMALAILAVRFQDVVQLMAVVLQFLFLATPIMYPLSMVPEGIGVGGLALRDILAASPLAQFVEMARTLLYDLQPGTLGQWAVLGAWAAAALGIGAAVSARSGRDVAEWVQ